eukprot:TRINITY_DN11064_c0_g1_i1.p1 TRINITY_DN11064_c0_g1~~TRINITY_DN11064_c0_g1_i1.p1  ORF type:complete len:771 (+),score=138.89 TRINITY_DN11064_c0_g1_i1:74-2314(+)
MVGVRRQRIGARNTQPGKPRRHPGKVVEAQCVVLEPEQDPTSSPPEYAEVAYDRELTSSPPEEGQHRRRPKIFFGSLRERGLAPPSLLKRKREDIQMDTPRVTVDELPSEVFDSDGFSDDGAPGLPQGTTVQRADLKADSPEFQRDVLVWALRCVDFQKAQSTWLPRRPCCLPNYWLEPREAPDPKDLVPCLLKLTMAQRMSFESFLRSGKAKNPRAPKHRRMMESLLPKDACHDQEVQGSASSSCSSGEPRGFDANAVIDAEAAADVTAVATVRSKAADVEEAAVFEEKRLRPPIPAATPFPPADAVTHAVDGLIDLESNDCSRGSWNTVGVYGEMAKPCGVPGVASTAEDNTRPLSSPRVGFTTCDAPVPQAPLIANGIRSDIPTVDVYESASEEEAAPWLLNGAGDIPSGFDGLNKANAVSPTENPLTLSAHPVETAGTTLDNSGRHQPSGEAFGSRLDHLRTESGGLTMHLPMAMQTSMSGYSLEEDASMQKPFSCSQRTVLQDGSSNSLPMPLSCTSPFSTAMEVGSSAAALPVGGKAAFVAAAAAKAMRAAATAAAATKKAQAAAAAAATAEAAAAAAAASAAATRARARMLSIARRVNFRPRRRLRRKQAESAAAALPAKTADDTRQVGNPVIPISTAKGATRRFPFAFGARCWPRLKSRSQEDPGKVKARTTITKAVCKQSDSEPLLRRRWRCLNHRLSSPAVVSKAPAEKLDRARQNVEVAKAAGRSWPRSRFIRTR